MPYFTKYHLAEQPAAALLGPVRDTLRELEARMLHYAERLNLTDADVETLRAAHRALASVRAEIERLQQGSPVGTSTAGG